MTESADLYGVRLKSLNRYHYKTKIYNFGRIYMVNEQERFALLSDGNGDYWMDVAVDPEEYKFFTEGSHVIALRNGNGRSLGAPPPVRVPAVQPAPVGSETTAAPEPSKKLRLKTQPREIVAGEASTKENLHDAGEGVSLGNDTPVAPEFSDSPGVEV